MEQDYVKTHNQDGLVLLSVGDHVFHPSVSRRGEELSKLNWRNDVEVTCNVTTQNSQFLTETNLRRFRWKTTDLIENARRKRRPRVPAIERFVFTSQVVTKHSNSSRSLYWLVSSKWEDCFWTLCTVRTKKANKLITVKSFKREVLQFHNTLFFRSVQAESNILKIHSRDFRLKVFCIILKLNHCKTFQVHIVTK